MGIVDLGGASNRFVTCLKIYAWMCCSPLAPKDTKLLAMRDPAKNVNPLDTPLVLLSLLLSLSQARQADGSVDGVKDFGEAAFE